MISTSFAPDPAFNFEILIHVSSSDHYVACGPLRRTFRGGHPPWSLSTRKSKAKSAGGQTAKNLDFAVIGLLTRAAEMNRQTFAAIYSNSTGS